jgi:hypothetical protein
MLGCKFRTLWNIRKEFSSLLKQMETLLDAYLNFVRLGLNWPQE